MSVVRNDGTDRKIVEGGGKRPPMIICGFFRGGFTIKGAVIPEGLTLTGILRCWGGDFWPRGDGRVRILNK